MVKVCTKCKIEKSTRDFDKNSKAKDGLQSWCKSCNKASSLRRYYERKSAGLPSSDQATKFKAIEILGNKCSFCGFDDPRALQIDHKNGGGNAERKVLGHHRKIHRKIVSGDTLDYQLLCANCNTIKCWEDNDYYIPSNGQ